jgi:GntR family transcriptional regulator, transcriptional repressor for pyruvate dehydrogenase complex
MARFKPIKQVRVSEEVTDQLKRAILQGQFRPGQRLPAERDLAAEFQVSRLSIREALRKLETSGFTETRQGAAGGAYVTELTFQYLSDAFLDLFLAGKISIPELHRVRQLIDPEIARLAALRVTPESAQALEQAYQAEKGPARSPAERIQRGTAVHRLLAEMSGNRFLEAIARSVMDMTQRFLVMASPDLVYSHEGLHRPIIDAVIAGDPRAAYATMKKHALEFGEQLVRIEKQYRKQRSGTMGPTEAH